MLSSDTWRKWPQFLKDAPPSNNQSLTGGCDGLHHFFLGKIAIKIMSNAEVAARVLSGLVIIHQPLGYQVHSGSWPAQIDAGLADWLPCRSAIGRWQDTRSKGLFRAWLSSAAEAPGVRLAPLASSQSA